MSDSVTRFMAGLRLGEVQRCGAVTVVPLLAAGSGPEYLTADGALRAGTLELREVAGGRVPELHAENTGGTGVLILEAEELLGAKQNRVLNTSVYLEPHSQVIIPVSCVEQGRWHDVSDRFRCSRTLASHVVRDGMRRSVSANLRGQGAYRSDQGEVWHEVERFQTRAKMRSRTGAMSEVFESRVKELDGLLHAFPVQRDQVGVAVAIGGRIVGVDVVSRPEVYARFYGDSPRMHDKILRAYLIEAALVEYGGDHTEVDFAGFLTRVALADCESYQAPGGGGTLRLKGLGAIGVALSVGGHIVHLAASDEARRVSTTSSRIRSRIDQDMVQLISGSKQVPAGRENV